MMTWLWGGAALVVGWLMFGAFGRSAVMPPKPAVTSGGGGGSSGGGASGGGGGSAVLPPPDEPSPATVEEVPDTAPVVRPTGPVDEAAARAAAQPTADMVREEPTAARTMAALMDFQRFAGLLNTKTVKLKSGRVVRAGEPDGLFGGRTRGALLYFGAGNVPEPSTLPATTYRYVP